ncbi:uncharacterized protein LOC105702316 [Orussus abietinus]|uniref:uncharacterized protein LOC105702316 n=1 Tax=Orussus abietinus TaxID=222816 RepID=UPI000626DB13|nr:uncharacterized protein LOC105702316 [Orussus abietinus]
MSCFGGREERIFLVELMVGKLRLTKDRVQDSADCDLVVKIKFLEFPNFEVSRDDFKYAKPPPLDGNGALDFGMGRSCLFTKQPRDLVQAMRTTPVKVGIFCRGDNYPLAETEVRLSGCLCDQIVMASNDLDHLPKPYVLNGDYDLVDPGGNPSGSVHLDFRLTCLGKSITTHYRMQAKSFLFKNNHDEGEFCVKRMSTSAPGDESKSDGNEEVVPNPVEVNEQSLALGTNIEGKSNNGKTPKKTKKKPK